MKRTQNSMNRNRLFYKKNPYLTIFKVQLLKIVQQHSKHYASKNLMSFANFFIMKCDVVIR